MYLQDEWKLTPKLTATLALRYELEQPITERFNRSVRGFDPTAASPIEAQAKAKYALAPITEIPADQFRVRGGLTFPGVNGLPRSLWNNSGHHLMPRVGIAYALNSRTVVRSGYGIFFDPVGALAQEVKQLGFSSNTVFNASLDSGQTFVANLTNPFPNGLVLPRGAQDGLATYLGNSVDYFPGGLQSPYQHKWQIGVQRQLTRESLIEISYVGMRGHRIPAGWGSGQNFNGIPNQYLSDSPMRDQATIDRLSAAVSNPFYPLLPSSSLAGATVARTQLLRPYPQFMNVTSNKYGGDSWFHSLQTRFERRFSESYTVSAAWTWQKLIDATLYQNAGDRKPERIISYFDRTHSLVISGVWELPFGRGKKWGTALQPVVSQFVSNWQVQGIYQGMSGPPLGFGNAIFTGNLKDVVLPGNKRNPQHWLNVAGFERSPAKQLDYNVMRFSSYFSGIRGDGKNQWDLSAIKNIDLVERVRLQLRAEFFNALNHPQWSVPDTEPTSSSFGMVTDNSAGMWPRVIQFGLKVLF